MAIAIQLRGREQVVEAFENQGVNCWAIFQYKSLMTKGEGEEMLTKFLDLLSLNASSAIYTLKTYEDIEDPKAIKEKTPASGSLNFRLVSGDFDNENNPLLGKEAYKDGSIYNRIADLEKRLEEANEPQEPQSFNDAITGLLGNPQELIQLIGQVKELFSSNNNQSPMRSLPMQNQNTMQAVGAIGEDDRLQRLANAIDKLEKNDANIVEHLEKLAEMASKDPAQFKFLTSLLDKMN